VYYDYASERGYILMDRDTMLRYLPDPAIESGVFVTQGASVQDVRNSIQAIAAGHRILIFPIAICARSDSHLRPHLRHHLCVGSRRFLVAVMGSLGPGPLVIDRRRELGLMRFLARRLRRFTSSFWSRPDSWLSRESCRPCAGYFLSLILVFVINKQSFGWTIRFHWPVAVILGASVSSTSRPSCLDFIRRVSPRDSIL